MMMIITHNTFIQTRKSGAYLQKFPNTHSTHIKYKLNLQRHYILTRRKRLHKQHSKQILQQHSQCYTKQYTNITTSTAVNGESALLTIKQHTYTARCKILILYQNYLLSSNPVALQTLATQCAPYSLRPKAPRLRN